MFPFFNQEHADSCQRKQEAIATQVTHYASLYDRPLTDDDAAVLKLSLVDIVDGCNNGSQSPAAVLNAFGKRAFAAHAATNCLADLMFDEAAKAYAPGQPLSGVPVSLKDVVNVEGHDTTLGFSSKAHKPAAADAPIVRLLRDAGALLPVKTTVPTGLLSFECESDLFGRTSNPYNPAFSPGASTGGGAALLAYGGSKIEIATDIGGSVRYPAAYCGVYGMKASCGRFPSAGCQTCVPGLEGMQTASPMARSLDDLQAFWERVVGMKPWEYDYTCVPVPWRSVDFLHEDRKPRWGVMWNDGLMTPTPACKRALVYAVDALQEQGYELVDFDGPSIIEGLRIGFPLAFADGGKSVAAPLSPSESINPAIGMLLSAARLPLLLKQAVASYLRWRSTPIGRNDSYAAVLEAMHPQTVAQERELVIKLQDYRARFADAMREQGIDFILTVPHPLPPMPKHGTGKATLLAASYAFFYNILDFVAGVVPTTYVDKNLDSLPPNFQDTPLHAGLNDGERELFSLYDAEAMHGLPLAVQIVGKRFEEEKVLEGMQIVRNALKASGRPFIQRDF